MPSKLACLALVCLLLGACSVTVDVIGRVEPGSELYRGTATAESLDGGKIEMAAPDGNQCMGEYSFRGKARSELLPTTPSGGLAHLFCSDGRTALVRFTSLSSTSGYGYGRASDGSAVRFAFGLSEADAASRLGTDPTAEKKRPTGKGTGFFVGGAGEVMTNAHVAGNCASISALLADGNVHAGRLLASDPINDLALVKLDLASPNALAFHAAPAYRLGDTVVSYGFPLPGMLPDSGNLTSGSITALSGIGNDSRYIQVSAPLQKGNSGGPLVDETGVVVGVVTLKLDALATVARTGDLPQNANFAVKEVFARTFMQANGISPLIATGKATKKPLPEHGDLLKTAVVQLTCHGD